MGGQQQVENNGKGGPEKPWAPNMSSLLGLLWEMTSFLEFLGGKPSYWNSRSI